MSTAATSSPPPDPDFDPSEVMASQAPALQLLVAMGWQYLSPAKARQLRHPVTKRPHARQDEVRAPRERRGIGDVRGGRGDCTLAVHGGGRGCH